jgi:DNA polymerase-3 subunit gamma/tau
MSYQVIARKWRPQTFDEVTGQEPITRTLKNAIEHERLHHAYLFSGARGVGKTTTARLLAKALNCHKSNRPTATPCAMTDPTACPSCKEIAEGRSIDVMEIDAASNTSVDNVRDAIIGTVAIAPARDRYKVFIIDEVHMLSTSAFNALLKTLEEPPPRVVFIMATTERHKLPETILSRSQQFEFRTIATAKIAERLRLIADAENVRISDEALKEIARAGEGSMRDAQSAFDQVISFSGEEIKVEDVEMALGLAGSEMLRRVMHAVMERSPVEALTVVDDLVMRGHDLRNFCRDLQAHVRDLLVARVANDSDELLDASASDPRELREQAAAFSESDLVRFFHSLTDTEATLRTATQPRYQLEVGLVKLIEMKRLAPISELVERLTALEEALRSGAPPAPVGGSSSPASGGDQKGTPAPAVGRGPSPVSSARAERASVRPLPGGGLRSESPALPAPAEQAAKPAAPPPLTLVSNNDQPRAEAQPAAGGSGRASVSDGTALQRIKAALEDKRKMLLVTAIEGAHRALIDGEELCIEFSPSSKHLRDSLAKAENVKVLREACREVLGRDIGVRIAVKEPGETDDPSQPPSPIEAERRDREQLREMAENDPAVQQLLKTFHGEIVDVRRVEEPE